MAKYLINVQFVSLLGKESQGKIMETEGIVQDSECNVLLAMLGVTAWWWNLLPGAMFWDHWCEKGKEGENFED